MSVSLRMLLVEPRVVRRSSFDKLRTSGANLPDRHEGESPEYVPPVRTLDLPLMLSPSKHERLAQDVLVEPRAVRRSSFDKLRTSGANLPDRSPRRREL